MPLGAEDGISRRWLGKEREPNGAVKHVRSGDITTGREKGNMEDDDKRNVAGTDGRKMRGAASNRKTGPE